ncbi:cellulase family glycosylhydrolase [Arachidicoccus terrestris]|uniref:cellulase family glycosylhydrolase n=1 Tax=Arachidicoccus terrestris TaxID=2875539 RepID=UPI001CC4D1FE|nr:cellulase family glycosylhydrolase [Arachidicoccus terrestris]UAY54388.1 cellulase family glycosylhydrolase [Arachidicoccus terrestris]
MAYTSLFRIKWLLNIGLFIAGAIGVHQRADAQFLRTSGTHITDGKDSSFIIRSIGLGGYMLQEGYMFHVGFLGTQTKIREKIRDMVGEEGTEQFYKDWRQNFIQQADIDSMAAWGFNAVRLPMHYNLFTLPIEQEPFAGKNTWLPEGFRLVDTLLSWCSQAHVYLILDLHAAPGGQGNDLPISDRDPARPSLWQSQANQEKTVALWEKLAKRYKDQPYIGGYDLLNETNWGFEDSTDIRGTKEQHNQPLWALLKRITESIRQYDKRHMIILEGNGFANNYHGLDSLWDNNTVLSFHKYGNFNDKTAIRYFLDLRNRLQAPVWLGESGENSNNWYMQCIRLMEDNQIGWSWWPWKKMGLNNPLEIKMPPNYDAFIRYAAGKGPQPPAGKGSKLLKALINNIRIQNNIIHRDVIDALFRRVQDPTSVRFKQYTLNGHPCYVLAADYDLGANGYAYLDKDTARYQYTPGVHTDGNKGRQYRNDGVDIRIDSASGKPYVCFIQDGEWLNYTLDIQRSGKYQLQLDYAKDKQMQDTDSLNIEIMQADKTVGDLLLNTSAPANGTFTISRPVTIMLNKSSNLGKPVKLIFKKGGLLLRGIIFRPVTK